jgi:hypothetical protein
MHSQYVILLKNRVFCQFSPHNITSDHQIQQYIDLRRSVGTARNYVKSIKLFRSDSVTDQPATTLCGKKLERYSTLSVMVESEPLVWANRHRFYDLGFAARASNSAYIQ